MSSQSQSGTTHVIFDFNGTIINVRNTMNKMLKIYAERVDENRVQSQLCKVGEVGANGIIKIYYDALNSPCSIDYKDFAKEFVDRTMKVGFELLPGVDKLMKHLYKNNIPMAVATNTNKKLLEREFNNTFGLNMNYISHYVCGDDPEVKSNKPEPDVYVVCAKRFDPAPKSIDRCVIFEDSLLGITGAVNTGMKTVLINDQSNEMTNKISVIIDSLDNFKPESVGLPPYQILNKHGQSLLDDLLI